MEAFYNWLNSLVNKNKSEFAEWADINWLTPYNTEKPQKQREQLLEKIGNHVLFKGTKPFYNHISKGCEICGQGKWSCLFITGKCNAGCFYCPAPQLKDEAPSTQGIDFHSSLEYADYINHFKFNGVSFSGGEPLLYFDRTLEYLRKVRVLCSTDIYIWMYTNGILADKEKITQLADAGLNEIRFDIGATAFSLDKIKYARDTIPNITIEIPAIPEEKDKLIELLPQMVKAGVTNLNLHQLRLTRHNAAKLIKRGYSIINAEKPIVLESELAALEIINYAREHNIDIGINYCSFFFKYRFQKAGFRKQMALALASNTTTITQSGYLREYSGDSISYKTIKLYEQKPEHVDFKKLILPEKIYYYTETILLNKTNLSSEYIERINQIIENEPHEIPSDPLLFKVWQLEYIENSLRDY